MRRLLRLLPFVLGAAALLALGLVHRPPTVATVRKARQAPETPLRKEGPDSEKLAFLRQDRSAARLEHVAYALSSLPHDPRKEDSVPAAALRTISEEVASDPESRRFLEDQVWEGRWTSLDLRRRAAAALFASADPPELARLMDRLLSESDPAFVDACVGAIRDGEAIRRLSESHPDPEIRRRIRYGNRP